MTRLSAQHVGHSDAAIHECLCTAVEEGLAGRILSDLLVGEVDELIVERHRQMLAAEHVSVNARNEAA